jgi:hypothetical protein
VTSTGFVCVECGDVFATTIERDTHNRNLHD